MIKLDYENYKKLKRGAALTVFLTPEKSTIYYLVEATEKYKEVLVKANEHKILADKGVWSHDFKVGQGTSIEIQFEDEVIEDPMKKYALSESIKVENIFKENKIETDDDIEWEKQAREKVRQKSLQENLHQDTDAVKSLFKKEEKVIDIFLVLDDLENKDLKLMFVQKNPETIENVIKPEDIEDDGEITDYKTEHSLIRVVRCDSINSTKYGIKSLPSELIDVAIIDAPYGMAFRSNTRKKENRHMAIKNDDNLNFVPEWLRQLDRVTKKDSFIYLFFSHHHIEILVAEVKKVFGDGYKLILVWEKDNTTAGDLESWGSQTEFILFIKKGSKSLTEVRDGNVLKFSKVVTDNHPTEKPLDLIQYLLHNSCKPGETVLDTFAGSGVLAEAALYEKVNCIVMEYEKKYYKYICHRITKAINQPSLLKDVFSEGLSSRTDKYIKFAEANYNQRLKEEVEKESNKRIHIIVDAINYELKYNNKGVIAALLRLLEYEVDLTEQKAIGGNSDPTSN